MDTPQIKGESIDDMKQIFDAMNASGVYIVNMIVNIKIVNVS